MPLAKTDTGELYPLQALLRLRQQEEEEARRGLALANAAHGEALAALEATEREAHTFDEALVAFQIEAAGRRVGGYTIAQRHRDGQEERDLLQQVRRAEARRELARLGVQQASLELETHRDRWQEARYHLEATRRHHERWRGRQVRQRQSRREEEAAAVGARLSRAHGLDRLGEG
jgi:hypothetical protein